MKRTVLLLVLALSVLLSGCGAFLSGEYEWVAPHQMPVSPGSNQSISVVNYRQLFDAIAAMVQAGSQQATISVEQYDRNSLEADISRVGEDVCAIDPMAAYAVDTITCTQGTSGGEAVLAVKITYIHDQAEIKKVKLAKDNAEAEKLVGQALNGCDAALVMTIEQYESMDFIQFVANYAMENPGYVMENPQVTENVYPESGKSRVVELKFTYQTSRESLKNMQTQVSPVFASAVLYVSGDGKAYEKYAQLYSFLMERYEYKLETSITPAYSLLRHGVGDCKAFAMVYGSMCRQAGLDCQLVSGTRDGEPWYWNVIQQEGVYYHVDLLRCSENGEFVMEYGSQMEGYVWDYAQYPVSEPPANEQA